MIMYLCLLLSSICLAMYNTLLQSEDFSLPLDPLSLEDPLDDTVYEMLNRTTTIFMGNISYRVSNNFCWLIILIINIFSFLFTIQCCAYPTLSVFLYPQSILFISAVYLFMFYYPCFHGLRLSPLFVWSDKY